MQIACIWNGASVSLVLLVIPAQPENITACIQEAAGCNTEITLVIVS